MTPERPTTTLGFRLQHVGFVVGDLERAARHFADAFGAGPFLALPHVEFDQLSYAGSSCTWEHSLAFGAWGNVQIELQLPHAIAPPTLADLIGRIGCTHLSYRVDDLEGERARLRRNGLDPFLDARVGPVEFSFFQDPMTPTYIEVHRAGSHLEAFDAQIAAAASNWDGKHALLALETPPNR